MATTSIVRLNDSDIERLAAALEEGVELQLTEIAARLRTIEALLPDIEARLAEKKASRKKAVRERGDDQ